MLNLLKKPARNPTPFLAILLILSLAAAAYLSWREPALAPPEITDRATPAIHPPAAGSPPVFEEEPVLLPKVAPADPKPPRPLPPVEPRKPKMAIVIDDMGYRQSEGAALLALELNLSFSFLPFAPHTAEQAQEAQRRRRDILLHLPLEATDAKWQPGPGTLYVSMSAAQQRATFASNMAAVPMAIGINNHMGSKFTENHRAMTVLLNLVRENHLFFVDSVTTARSVAAPLAETLGIKTVRRHIFLDNIPEKEKISDQIMAGIALAENKGWTVVIGHPYPATLAALRELQDLLNRRVELVGVHQLVR